MTTIKQMGGEFALIEWIARPTTRKEVIVGIGDDAAVVTLTKTKHLLLTTDMMVEDVHFRRKWCTPKQIGIKLMESNISDIAAMGGEPLYALVSGCLPKNTTAEFVEQFFEGMRASGKAYGIEIVGGDTTRGEKLVFSLTLVGKVKKRYMCLRSGAKQGHLIGVTGTLGKSHAGLRLLQAGKRGAAIQSYLEPQSRMDASCILRSFASSMIDVSDGLASEIRHLCKKSDVGAVLEKEKIPVSSATKKVAMLLHEDPYAYALYGGEDYELLFTLTPKNIAALRKEFGDFTIIGIITAGKDVLLKDGKRKTQVGKGFDHFL
ncbi:thiamine-phosphate kinase [Candidatus Woesearchaeota archaeon]|nr:thiamine-phosphate kinase [Candidatus Woesearchaeota archaeon]